MAYTGENHITLCKTIKTIATNSGWRTRKSAEQWL